MPDYSIGEDDIDVSALPVSGFRLPDAPPPPTAPSVGAVLGAGFRRENAAVSFLSNQLMTGGANWNARPVAGFNPLDHIPATQRLFANRYALANDQATVDAITRQLEMEQADEHALNGSGLLGVGARIAGGILDPINLVPIGGELFKGGSILKNALRAAAMNAGITAAEEAALHTTQLTRTYGESAANVAGATVLSGLVVGAGGLVGRALNPAELPRLSQSIESQLTVPTTGRFTPEEVAGVRTEVQQLEAKLAGLDPAHEDHLVGTFQLEDAKAKLAEMENDVVHYDLLEPESIPVSEAALARDTDDVLRAKSLTAEAFGEGVKDEGFIKNLPIMAKQDPLIRTTLSQSIETRKVVQQLAETPLKYDKNLLGIANPVPVESRIRMWQAPLAQGLTQLDDFFAQYRLGRGARFGEKTAMELGDALGQAEGKMTFGEFKEAVSVAMRRGDTHAIPEVTQAARMFRQTIFNPLKDAAAKLGLLDELGEVGTADSYLTRLWNKDKINARYKEFFDINLDYLAKKEPERVARLQAAENELAALEGRVPDTIAPRYKEELEAVVKTLIARIASVPEGRIRYDVMQPDGLFSDLLEQTNKKLPLDDELDNLVANHWEVTKSEFNVDLLIDQLYVTKNSVVKVKDILKGPKVTQFFNVIGDVDVHFLDDKAFQKKHSGSSSKLTSSRAFVKPSGKNSVEGIFVKKSAFVNSPEQLAETLTEEMTHVLHVQKGRLEKHFKKQQAVSGSKYRDEIQRFTAYMELPFEASAERMVKHIFGHRVQSKALTLKQIILHEMNNGTPSLAKKMDRKGLYSKQTNGLNRSLKSRVYDIPDELVEDFLENDVEYVAKSYVRSMAPDVEMIKQFGDISLEKQIADIQADYARKKLAATSEKVAAEWARREAQDIKDLVGMRDRMRGMYGLPSDPNSGFVKAGRWARGLNFLSLMGGVMLSSVPDIAQPILKNGLLNWAKAGLVPLLTDWKAIGLAGKEVKLAGEALDMVLGGRAMQLAEVMDDYGRGNVAERLLQEAQGRFSVGSGIAGWTSVMKQVTGSVAGTKMLQTSVKHAAGKATRKEVGALAASYIDQAMAKRIAGQFNEFGEKRGSVWIANTEKWTDPEAVDIFRAGLGREVNRTIVTPGQDKPLFMSTEWGKLFSQFKSFFMATTQRVLLSGLQERDLATLNGLVGSVALGAISVKLANVVAGRDDSSWGAEDWIVEGADRSGIFGWPFEVNNMVEKASRGTVGISAALGKPPMTRYQGRNFTDALLGPTAGRVEDAARVTGAATASARTGVSQWTRADVRAVRRLMPFQNLFYTRKLFDAMEEGFADAVGAPPDARYSYAE